MNTLEILKNCLCPPGEGVFTVNTAKERKERLQNQLFPKERGNIKDQWTETLKQSVGDSPENSPLLLGITSDCGGGIQRGANWGPLFLRDIFYKEDYNKELPITDLGDIRTIPHLLHDKYLNQETINSCRHALYGNKDLQLPVAPLSITELICEKIYDMDPNKIIIALGGDHSVSYPLTRTYLQKQKKLNKRTGLIHFDAHTDLLSSRLGIDLCFGSWTYHILNDLYDTTDLYQIGIRSSGQDRNHWENKFTINQYWNYEVAQKGPVALAEEMAKDMHEKGIKEIYISFDIDAIDSNYASATGTPEENGLEPHTAIQMINYLTKEFKLTGCDLVEVAPLVSYPNQSSFSDEPYSTLKTGSQIMASFLEGIFGNH